MKTVTLITLAAALSACALYSQTNFIRWSNQQTLTGSGGAVRAIGPYEYWQYGAPERGFRVLGVIEQYSGKHLLLRSYNRTQIVETIERVGGDGVIAMQDRSFVTGATLQPDYGTSGSTLDLERARNRTLVVFQYAPNDSVASDHSAEDGLGND